MTDQRSRNIEARTGDGGLNRVIGLWCLRALVDLGLCRRLGPADRLDEELRQQLDLPAVAADAKPEPGELERVLRVALARAQRSRRRRAGLLFENVALMGEALGLCPVERELVTFAVAVELSTPLHELVSKLEPWSTPQVAAVLGKLLKLPVAAVLHALRPDGTLLSSRLVALTNPERRRGAPLVPMDGLAALLLSRHGSKEALVAHFFGAPRPARCTLDDFPHARADLEQLARLLRHAVQRGERGVNVLLHGPPGTGKTELARALAAALAFDLYAVADQDPEGASLAPSRRFSAYALCQKALAARGGCLVLFDEIEDVFPQPSTFGSTREGAGKAWTNRLLEENPVPALWVSNGIDHIDPAYLRRFDYLLELRAPPIAVRRRLLDRRLAGHAVPEAVLQRLARDERLTPSHVERAARLCVLTAPQTPEATGALVSRYLRAALDVQGRRPGHLPTDGPAYDLAWVNTTCDLPRLMTALRARPAGALCLSGAPGTGKTAFAQHLAEELGKPLRLWRASDLLDCYVGGTEANLAAMFRQAADEDAVLLLDEADGFLRDRAGARNPWEVTQVNELLVQLDSFEGLFLCATNAFDTLDPASLRRFSLKLRFEPLRAEQRWALLSSTLATLGLDAGGDGARERLRARLDPLDGLTVGDFRTVLRQSPLIGAPEDCWQLVERLEDELRQKPERRRNAVGFDPRPAVDTRPMLRSGARAGRA